VLCFAVLRFAFCGFAFCVLRFAENPMGNIGQKESRLYCWRLVFALLAFSMQ